MGRMCEGWKGVASRGMAAAVMVLGAGGARGQWIETISTPSVMSGSVSGLVCPIDCSSVVSAWGTVTLNGFDPTLGTLIAVEVRVTAVAGGVFEWAAASVNGGGEYVVETPLEVRATAPGFASLAGFFWVEECAREIGPRETWGRCDLSPSLGESSWRAANAASRWVYGRGGTIEIPVSVRFYPQVTIAGVPWFTWSERLQAEVRVQARYLYCSADFNRDGFLDFFDYDAYVECYEGVECPEGVTADFNRDGFVDLFDLYAFDAVYQAGCVGL